MLIEASLIVPKGAEGVVFLYRLQNMLMPRNMQSYGLLLPFQKSARCVFGMSEVDSRKGPGMEAPVERRWLRKHLLSLKTLSLVVLSVQTSTMVLLLRYSRTTSSPQPYIITTAVLLSELLKLVLSLCFLHLDSGRYCIAKVIDGMYVFMIIEISGLHSMFIDSKCLTEK